MTRTDFNKLPSNATRQYIGDQNLKIDVQNIKKKQAQKELDSK